MHVCLQILFSCDIQIDDLFVCHLLGLFLLHSFVFSLRCSTRQTRNSLDNSLPPCVSLTLSLPTFSSTVTTSVMALQTSGSTSCAVILPEFLASVIQGIQTLISAIMQQSLSATVSAPPVPVSIQGLHTTAQSSNYPALADTSIISR